MDPARYIEGPVVVSNRVAEELVDWQQDPRSRSYDETRPRLMASSKTSPIPSTSSQASESPQSVPSLRGGGFTKLSKLGQRPHTGQRSASNDSYRSSPSSVTHVQKLRHRPSENPKLHLLGKSSMPAQIDGRHIPESPPEDFSRPAPSHSRDSQEPIKPVPNRSSTFPLEAPDDFTRQNLPTVSRDRGRSTSSSRSNSTFTPILLRPSTSIPDYSTAEPNYSRQRNFSNYSNYRPARGVSDINHPSHRREPPIRPNGLESGEVRASFRSALTNTSSFLETSGTERSSVLTKSSSATSVYGRDEGMSVDDAIEMYENGFADSGSEDNVPSRPGTSQSNGGSKLKHLDSSVASLGSITPPNFIVQDSAAMFEEPEGGFDSLDDPSSYDHSGFDKKLAHSLTDLSPNEDGQSLSPSTTHSSPQSFDETRDRYGFYKKSQHVPLAQYESWSVLYSEYLARRRKKWVALLKESNLPVERPSRFPPKSTKVKRFIRKGIPPDWRGAAWFYYAGGPAMVGKHHGLYAELVQRSANGEVSPTDQDDIERDLHRTFPDNVRFKPDPKIDQVYGKSENNSVLTLVEPETPILRSLRRVLRAFAIHNPRVGYCQSLNFLAGLLLLFMDEEKSFWLLNIIAREYLPGTHARNLEGANVDLGVLMMSVKETMPSIWNKIGGELDGSAGSTSSQVPMRLPPVTLCCTAWFMSCFIGTLPIETTLRVWDSFFYEGSKTFFRIALTIFKVGEAEIRAVSDPMEIFQVVQTIPRRLVDANAVLQACFKRRNGFGHLSQETIEARRSERRRGYVEERARVTGRGEGTVTVERKGTLFSRRRGKGRAATGVDLVG